MLVEADVAARPPRDDLLLFFDPKVAFPAGIVRAPAVRTTNTAAQREEGLHGVRFTPSPRDLVYYMAVSIIHYNTFIVHTSSVLGDCDTRHNTHIIQG